MVRYLHQDAAAICTYVRQQALKIIKCSCDGGGPIEEAAPADIIAMLRQTDTLWGTSLPHYYRATLAARCEPVDAAVSSVEQSPNPEFLIVAYQDGGLITVSGSELPFQVGERRADWWRPYRASFLVKLLGGVMRAKRGRLTP